MTQDLLELISGLSVDADSVTTLHVFPGPEAGPSCSVNLRETLTQAINVELKLKKLLDGKFNP